LPDKQAMKDREEDSSQHDSKQNKTGRLQITKHHHLRNTITGPINDGNQQKGPMTESYFIQRDKSKLYVKLAACLKLHIIATCSIL
jgi:hypothetical protein